MPAGFGHIEDIPAVAWDVGRVSGIRPQIELRDRLDRGRSARAACNARLDKRSVRIMDTGVLALEDGRKDLGLKGGWWESGSLEGSDLVAECVQGLQCIHTLAAGLMGLVSV